MVTSPDTSISSDSTLPDVHVRALTLSSTLSSMASGWNRIGVDTYALRSISPQHVDTTLCPHDSLLWLRTTLIQYEDGTWDLEEFSQSISELSTMVAPFDTNKRVTEVITIAHTSVVPPEALGFAMQSDDLTAHGGDSTTFRYFFASIWIC